MPGSERVEKPLLEVLAGTSHTPPPVWMMRQAGRHLPEYLELRSRAKDFLDFCYSPSLASEATLQPIRRYGMDGAILFADILLVLDALGLDVRFEKGVGPLVQRIEAASDLTRTTHTKAIDRLSPVFETVIRVKRSLPETTTLIGFAGAPFTVLLYAIEGRGKTDKATARSWIYEKPDEMRAALNEIVEITALYMKAQVEAGAEALMIFESWAEGLADDVFRELVIAPNAALVSRLRELDVSVPIIGFPRGAAGMLGSYVAETKVTGVGLDTAVVPSDVARDLPPEFPVQGHLDPLLLRAGGARLVARVRELLAAYAGRPHIFNLGHGVLPDTPIPHVELVLKTIRDGA
ncbi:MAG: uroporphyrinogen decarboxylase [Hyphomonadaceae bacterium]|nr:uroporphyrinogen decarboxylase [Hyphomonadaceae bacterium]